MAKEEEEFYDIEKFGTLLIDYLEESNYDNLTKFNSHITYTLKKTYS